MQLVYLLFLLLNVSLHILFIGPFYSGFLLLYHLPCLLSLNLQLKMVHEIL